MLTELTSVSPIVQFLIALIGLGVAIDYSLIVVSRWREERAHGRERRRGGAARDGDRRPRGRLQRHHGRDRPLRADRAAAAVPALDGLRRAADPAGLDAGRDHAAARRPGEVRASGSTGRTAAPTTRQAARGPAGRRASRGTAGSPPAPEWRSILALVVAATDLQLGTSDADTVAKSGDAKDGLVALEEAGIGEGSLLPHEILIEGDTDPPKVAADLRKVDGIHGAVAPGRRELAARRHRARRGDPDPGQRVRRGRGDARGRARHGARRRPRRARRRPAGRRTPTSSTPSTAASR